MDLNVNVNSLNNRFSMVIDEAPLHDAKAVMWCAANGTSIVESAFYEAVN
jgi:hypothetical protein